LTDFKRILAFCMMADKEENEARAEPNIPLRPPLAITAPQFSEDDFKFLHDCGMEDAA
jgi:hypothetical protein